MRFGLRIVHALLVLGCLAAAIAQFNDPDSAIWIVTYLVAGGLGFFGVLGEPRRIPSMIFAVVMLVWAARLATAVIGKQPIVDEEGREMLGLAIVGVWMLGLAIQSVVLPRQPPEPFSPDAPS